LRPGLVCPSRRQLYRAAASDPRRGGDARVGRRHRGERGQNSFICAMRRWLPNGSRRPKSMP
jgi:hypothetical protein